MTLDDVNRLNRYWTDHPPLVDVVRYIAGALGIDLPKPRDKNAKYMTEAEARRLQAMTGGRIPGVGRA